MFVGLNQHMQKLTEIVSKNAKAKICYRVSTMLSLILVIPFFLFAQTRRKKVFSLDSLTSKNLRFLPVPVLSVSPEGGVTFGFFVDYFYNTDGKQAVKTRASNSWLQATYSTKGQLIFEGFSSTYTPKEKYFVGFKGGFTNNYERFWGYTKDVAENASFTDISFQRTYVNTKVLKNLKRSIFLGPTVYYSNFTKADTSNGLNAGVLQMATMDSKVAGVGLNFTVDKRDSQFSPTAGYFIDLGGQYVANLNESKKDYVTFNTDLRAYFTLHQSEFAQQFYFAASNKEMPDLEKFKIGGGNILRGLFQGRYRDNAVWYTQSEYRYNINRHIKVAAFAGFGNTAPSLNQAFRQTVQATGGLGARLLVNKAKKVYLRLDVGFATRGFVGYYLRVGDAF